MKDDGVTLNTLEQAITRIAVLEERILGRDAALKLQAVEYERRLEDLNHAHQQAVEQRAQFLPREVYDIAVSEWRVWRTEVDIVLAVVRGRRDAYVGLLALVTAAASAVLWLIDRFV